MYQYDFGRRKPQSKWERLRAKMGEAQVDYKPLLPVELRGVPSHRTIYLLREPPLPEVQPRNRSNYKAAKPFCSYISGPDDFAPSPDYMPAIWYLSNSFEELDKGRIPDKVRPCSWITSGINRTANHRQRLTFLQQLKDEQLDMARHGSLLLQPSD